MDSKFISFILLVVAFIGCQPEPDSARLYDELVVSTNYDETADFSSYNTFAISTDTIGLISNTSRDTVLIFPKSDYPRPVLTRIRENLGSLGFTEVQRNSNPDLGVNVMVVTDFNYFQQLVYPDPYYYGGGYYQGYYGYGSPYYYYPYVATYAYNTAVLVIELVDLKNRNSYNQVKIIWNAYLGDLYSSPDLIEQTGIAIDQAFKQSPYLHPLND